MQNVQTLSPTSADSPSDLGNDVAMCDREPIHVPGAIQPHGLLLVIDAGTLTVVAGAGEIEPQFGADWLDRPAAALLGETAAETLRAAEGGSVRLGQVSAPKLEAVAHRADDRWLVQLEPPGLAVETGAALEWLDEAGGGFERAGSLIELCERAARTFRALTGFDRVMIYRFLDDDSGVVIAEDIAAGLHSFQNHHFPASDIPRQARALYIRNRVRVIPDVNYVTAPIRPPAHGGVDLSDVDLRSVSPIHLQYLRNMGVAASASVSIVKDGVLWGLVACHHRGPRTISYTDRRICQLLASSMARQIRAKEEAEDYRERLRVRASEDAVVARLTDNIDPDELFVSAGDELRRMFGADGFAIVHGPTLQMDGRCPHRDDVREIGRWVKRRGDGPFHTDRLASLLPGAEQYQDLASGLMSITLSADVPTVLMWFRAEERQVLEWAGNPHKAVQLAPGETLSPRKSFEAWTEEVRGRSRRWTAVEVEAAHRIMRLLFEARQNRRIRDLANDLGLAVADKDRLLAQKDTLLREVNHRVQNSLQLVVAFLGMQGRAENDPTLTRHLDEAQRRLSAVALVHRRLYADDNLETIDLSRYLEELIADLRGSMGPEWADRLTTDLAPILIPADSAVQVGLILVELVINAQKYAYRGDPGPIAIALEQHRARFRLIVADQGVGRTGTRKGFGTRMLGAMVDRLSGTLEEVDNRPGLRMILSAPVEQDGRKG
ncbi:MAG: histidine kinase dimerization/phosphoacceptor domain -containing protein [Sphingomonas sp.]